MTQCERRRQTRERERERERNRGRGKVLTPVRKYRLYFFFFTSSLAPAGVNFVKRPFPSPRVARKIPLTRARALVFSLSLFPASAHPLSSFARLSRRVPGENSSARFPPRAFEESPTRRFSPGVGETGCVFTLSFSSLFLSFVIFFSFSFFLSFSFFFFFCFLTPVSPNFRPPFSLRFYYRQRAV